MPEPSLEKLANSVFPHGAQRDFVVRLVRELEAVRSLVVSPPLVPPVEHKSHLISRTGGGITADPKPLQDGIKAARGLRRHEDKADEST